MATKVKPNTQWDWWINATKGIRGDVHDGQPESGFYRHRRRDAVAFWKDSHDGAQRCQINGKDAPAQRAMEIWQFANSEPITRAQYDDFLRDGIWHDMDASINSQVGHNKGPEDDAETIKDQIDAASAGIGEYAEIDSDEKQARAQSLRSRLNELSTLADKKRTVEKQPHLDAGKEVDARWQPLVKLAKAGADTVKAAMERWETIKLRKVREEQRKQEEAARKAAEAGKPAPAPAAPPAAPAPIKGAYGRAAATGIVKVATVADQDKVYAYMRERPEVIELLAKLAQRAVDAGHDVPGVTIEERGKVK